MTTAVSAADAALEIRDLRVLFGDRVAVDGLTLSVRRGEAFGLLGPNGSGKSTLIACLAGLRSPDSGEIRVHDSPPGPAARRRTGFVFQESGLDPLMTCRETLLLQAHLFGVAGAGAAADAGLERAGLSDRARSLSGTLSGGMKRRLAIARAILPQPELLVLDEPTVGLDPDSRRGLWAYLAELRGAGTTLLVASQDVLEIERGCESVAFLSAGRVALAGSIVALKKGLRRDAVIVEFDGAPSETADRIEGWPDVGSVTVEGDSLHVTVDDAATFVPRLFGVLASPVRGIRIRESSLEDAYFALSGSKSEISG
jgi:ABC-type multidrug transport system ATPase subunit